MRLLFTLGLLAALLPFSISSAHVEGGDCVIEDFQSDITVNRDSSIDIREDLLVDCGNLPDKHGIFLILPTSSPRRPDRGKPSYNRTPVTLESITDFSGMPHKYETIGGTNTVTWKIGDPDVTIQGLNEYRISYTVENAVYAEGSKDVLYWNLNGNFWELEIEAYEATIHFPVGIGERTMNVQLFSGDLGSSANNFSRYEWTGAQTLKVSALVPLATRQGITLKASFPQGIVTRYEPNFFQLYGGYFWYLPALGLLLVAYRLWSRFGRDPKLKHPEVVQYEPPLKLRPLEAGLLESFGVMRPSFLSATIVDLAVRGHLKITEIPKKGLLSSKDWELTRTNPVTKDLKEFEKKLLDELFGGGTTTKISEHKNKFYQHIDDIKKEASKELEREGLFDAEAPKRGWIMLGVTVAAILGGFLVIGAILYLGTGYLPFAPHGVISAVISVIGLVLAAVLMPRRTVKGAEAKHHLDGFRLYLSQAEKYRMQFYEKENIFEKYLPYAVAFNLTDKWVKAFQAIASAEYRSSYAPVWYAGATQGSFSLDGFTTQMNSIASDISSSLSSSPGGSGGGGGAGGGGGGGGGGSW